MEHTFTIDLVGTDTRQPFQGSFTYKRPTIGKRSEIDKTISRMNAGVVSLDEDTKLLHKMLSVLRHTLVAAPDWWAKSDAGVNLYDINVVIEIYLEVQKFEDEWTKKVWQEDAAAEPTKQ